MSQGQTGALNSHGDVLLPTTGFHGGNISSQRVDELDEACLEFVVSRASGEAPPVAIDIGGGNGAQAYRMARLGADVTFIDLTDQRAAIGEFNAALGRRAIRFVQGDVRAIDLRSIAQPFDVIYSQRMMGCIRYGELRSLLEGLYAYSNPGARCFLSASGLDTEYGADYPHRDRPIAARWSTLCPRMAEKHQMYAPECLYREEELADLTASCGFAIVRRWRSAFGTPKVIAQRRR